ncbi:hypothetical protein EON79_17595, partial [bacterium]
MRLKLDVLTEFGATWYPSATDTETLFDRAHREIVSELPVRWDVTDVRLIAGNDTYALPENVFRVDEAYYVPCADPSTWRRLEPFDFTFEPYDGHDWRHGQAPALPPVGWRVVPNAASNGGGLSFQISPTPPSPLVVPACPGCGDSPCCCDVGDEGSVPPVPDTNGPQPGDDDFGFEPGDDVDAPPIGEGSGGGIGIGIPIGGDEEDPPIGTFSLTPAPAPAMAYAGPGADPNPDPVPIPVTPDPLLTPVVYY